MPHSRYRRPAAADAEPGGGGAREPTGAAAASLEQRALAVGEHRGKRVTDVVVASLALLATFPLLLVLAAAVAGTSRGGAFFLQRRVGRGGREFPLVKLRTLRIGAEDDVTGRPELTDADFKVAADDARITRVGRVLRRTSLDELPQLANVVMGHMSLVGIRPVVRAQLATRPPHFQRLYIACRPGLTGVWQINDRSRRLAQDRVSLDEEWIRSWSFWGDVAILLRTPFAVARLGTH